MITDNMMITDKVITTIAQIAHEANRAYCQSIGDHSQPDWAKAPDWAKDSAIHGVEYHLTHLDAMPSDSHENWLKQKVTEGWVYGPIKDPAKKEHPCCVPYEELPPEQKVKDTLFINVVHAAAIALMTGQIIVRSLFGGSNG